MNNDYVGKLSLALEKGIAMHQNIYMERKFTPAQRKSKPKVKKIENDFNIPNTDIVHRVTLEVLDRNGYGEVRFAVNVNHTARIGRALM